MVLLAWILFIPLLGSIFAGLNAKIIGKSGANVITIILIILNCIISIKLFVDAFIKEQIYVIILSPWISSNIIQIDWRFAADNLTLIMLLVVNIISALVHIYSKDYMMHDPHQSRFMSYLSLFTFFMILLITGDNFLILFLGWEGVGLCSYLLISFWYTRIQANKAAIKALLINRVADIFLLIGIILICFLFKTLNFDIIFSLIPYVKKILINICGIKLNLIDCIALLLFIGAMGKSAQIGLHTWLPDAMEGPTPVSALIHAATMVTAGVFLIIKCSWIFEYVPLILNFMLLIGAMTAFFSATIGLIQNDIKKVIAYSTCSQLGYMVFACGLSNYNISFFHLVNHAFFKALLFLSAGAIIHSLSNEQDMRKFGSLGKILPFTTIMLLIGSLALVGFPFLSGFYSKDLILEVALTKYSFFGFFAYILGLCTVMFTTFYSIRVFYFTIIQKIQSFKYIVYNITEATKAMAIVLLILSFGSIFLGYFIKDLFIGLGSDLFNQSILILPANNNQVFAEFFALPSLEQNLSLYNYTRMYYVFRSLPFWISINIIVITYLLLTNTNKNLNFWFRFFKNWRKRKISIKKSCFLHVYKFLIFRWYFDVIINEFIIYFFFKNAYKTTFILFDKGFLEFFGPYGFSKFVFFFVNKLNLIQIGQVYYYAYFMIICLIYSLLL